MATEQRFPDYVTANGKAIRLLDWNHPERHVERFDGCKDVEGLASIVGRFITNERLNPKQDIAIVCPFDNGWLRIPIAIIDRITETWENSREYAVEWQSSGECYFTPPASPPDSSAQVPPQSPAN